MVDGFYISEGICAFIALLMPEIILEGKLYKVFPPLYNIDDGTKGGAFVNSKSDLAEYFMKKVSKLYDITLIGEDKPLKKDELFDFLDDTLDYYDKMKNLSEYANVDLYFIERIAYFIFGSNYSNEPDESIFENSDFVRDFMNFVQKKYPEVNLKKNTLRGPVNGKFVVIKISNRNLEKFAEFKDIFNIYGYEILVHDKKGNNPDRVMTIAEFMIATYGLRAKIKQRYKGLGEATGDQIGITTLDENNRILVQLTMDDAEKALETFHKLNSDKQKYRLLRKEMMENYRVDPSELDN